MHYRNLWTFLIRLKMAISGRCSCQTSIFGKACSQEDTVDFLQGRFAHEENIKIRPAATQRKSLQGPLSPVVLINSIRLSQRNTFLLHREAFSLIRLPTQLGKMFEPLTKLLMNQLLLGLTFLYIWILCSLSPLICFFFQFNAHCSYPEPNRAEKIILHG